MLDTLKTKVFPLFSQTFKEWQEDNCLQMGASLSYYALFSLFPLLLVILSVIGFLVVPGTEGMVSEGGGAREQIIQAVRENMSEQAANQVEEALNNLSASRGSAGFIGFATLLLTASGVFGALDRAFNAIWDVDPTDAAGGIVAKGFAMVRKKLFAFALVIGSALVLLISMIIPTVIAFLSRYTNWLPGGALIWQNVQFLASVALIMLVFMLLFKYLPDAPVTWGDVWLGALLTAVLFAILKQVISIYIGNSSFLSYGAVGGVMAILLWIYITSQILFLGGEFTQVYARMFGSHRTQAEPAEAPVSGPHPQPDLPLAHPQAHLPPEVPQPTQQTIAAAGVGAVVGVVGTIVAGMSLLVVGVWRAVRALRGQN